MIGDLQERPEEKDRIAALSYPLNIAGGLIELMGLAGIYCGSNNDRKEMVLVGIGAYLIGRLTCSFGNCRFSIHQSYHAIDKLRLHERLSKLEKDVNKK